MIAVLDERMLCSGVFMKRLSVIGAAVSLAVPGVASDASVYELALARKVLGQLQGQSAMENVEYCGYLGYDSDGVLVATEAVPGGAAWCEPVWPDDLEVVASYHTHADYDPTAWSEIPSGNDMESDEEEGIDGYVSTPGGRLWYIDTTDMVASQICGIGCLPRAPNFIPAPEDDIRESYSYDELIEKIAGH